MVNLVSFIKLLQRNCVVLLQGKLRPHSIHSGADLPKKLKEHPRNLQSLPMIVARSRLDRKGQPLQYPWPSTISTTWLACHYQLGA
jgi:hypothetical protein